jgi:hypothetical protein
MSMKTNINLRKTAWVVLCAIALSPAALSAKDTSKLAMERGTLKSVDNQHQQLVITDQKTKTDRTFQWNEQTRFTLQGKATSASGLKAGEHIVVNYARGNEPATLVSASAKPAKTSGHLHANAKTHPKG